MIRRQRLTAMFCYVLMLRQRLTAMRYTYSSGTGSEATAIVFQQDPSNFETKLCTALNRKKVSHDVVSKRVPNRKGKLLFAILWFVVFAFQCLYQNNLYERDSMVLW